MRSLFCLPVLLVASIAHAGPISLNVVQSSQTTTVSAGVDGINIPTTTRTNTGNSPITDSLRIPGSLGRGGDTWADASSNLFGVGSSTGAFTDIGAHSSAEAISVLLFHPLITQTADLVLEASVGDRAISFSDVTARLTDLTDGIDLWAYVFDTFGRTPDRPGDVTLPFDRTTEADQTIDLSLLTFLNANHLYQLTLSTFTNASIDRERVSVAVTGLHAVPEPASALLFATGVTVMAWRRRRRANS